MPSRYLSNISINQSLPSNFRCWVMDRVRAWNNMQTLHYNFKGRFEVRLRIYVGIGLDDRNVGC